MKTECAPVPCASSRVCAKHLGMLDDDHLAELRAAYKSLGMDDERCDQMIAAARRIAEIFDLPLELVLRPADIEARRER